MLDDVDRSTIISVASAYGARRVLLFGSAADPLRPGRDIDLAVEGVDPGRFFKFYGELVRRLSKPVDVIDLADDTKFVQLIRRDGISIYG